MKKMVPSEELSNTTATLSLINLPEKLMGHVLTYLHPASVCQVGYSCQALLRLVFSFENLFENIRIPYKMTDKGLESFLVRCNAKKRTQSLDLSYSRHLTGSGLGPLLGSSIMEVLDLRSMPCLSYTSVLPLLCSMSSLWSLDCSIKNERKGNKKVTLPEGYLDVWNLRGEVLCRKAAQEDTWQCTECQSSNVVARCHKKDCTKMVCEAHIASNEEGAVCPDCKSWVCKGCRLCSGCFACEKCRVETEECGNCGKCLCYKCYTRCQSCGHIECGCETLRYCISCGCTPMVYDGKVKDNSTPIPAISNWQTKSSSALWNTVQVHGIVTGHHGIVTGNHIATSNIVAGNPASGFEITTSSGSRYFLGRKVE
jgi:hypothetical protein